MRAGGDREQQQEARCVSNARDIEVSGPVGSGLGHQPLVRLGAGETGGEPCFNLADGLGEAVGHGAGTSAMAAQLA